MAHFSGSLFNPIPKRFKSIDNQHLYHVLDGL